MSRRSLNLGRRSDGVGMAQARSRGRAWIRIARIAALVLMIVGAVVLVRWMRTSPVFMIDRLETGRYRYSTLGEVEQVLQARLGTNIWTCDTDSLMRDLDGLPWVHTAEITRRPPGTLAVRLREWKPLLLIADAEGGEPKALLADLRILPLPDHVSPPDLPVYRDGDGSLTEDDLAALLTLVEAVDATGLDANRTLASITENGTGLILDLGAEKGRLLVGREAFTSRLQRYLAVADDLPSASSVDLRFEGQVYVKELAPTPQSG